MSAIRPPVLRLNLADHELIVDNFAGGGGASTGIERATGRSPDIAINHDAEALAMHEANHPRTRHIREDVWAVDPVVVCGGRPVGLAWFSPDCFPAGTMILTREGYRPVEEIAVGDEVLTHERRWRRVTHTYRAVRPLVRLRGQGHPGLLVSPEHPFYARKRQDVWRTEPRGYERRLDPAAWTRAGDLERGWYWATPADFPEATPPPVPVYRGRETSITTALLWLAGRYVADGWTRLTGTRAELVITCGRHEVDDLRRSLSAWPRSGTRSGSDELAWHERETGTAYQFAANHRGLVEWLREQFGHGAAEKTIPGWVLGMPHDLRTSFLEGYLSGDGCVSRGHGTPLTVATTVSKALAFGLKGLAASLGYTANVHLRESQPDVIEGRKVNVRPAWRVSWHAEIDAKHIQAFREDGLEWTAVRERTDDVSGAAEVFNIGVEEDESYVADGIIVHNCTYFSKARGAKPFRDRRLATRRRSLASVVIRWANAVQPRVILMENVEEWLDWGPLGADGLPDPDRKGLSFRRWKRQLERAGYKVEHRELRACDYGAPTTRKRLFVVARCDGQPIVWPTPTHGPGRAQPYRAAAECIDWSIPVPSIFGRKRPLAEPTMRRIARGLDKFVLRNPRPFVVSAAHGDSGGRREYPITDPLGTVTSGGVSRGVVVPYLVNTRNGERQGQAPRVIDPGAPYPTITAQGSQGGLVTAFLARNFGRGGTPGNDLAGPVGALTTRDHTSLVTAQLAMFDTRRKWRTDECAAFLVKYYGNESEAHSLELPLGTVTTRDRFGLVTVAGHEYQIVDIGFRMLVARELFRAQGFDDDYVIDPWMEAHWRHDPGRDVWVKAGPLSKTSQVRMCGNSVAPHAAEALVAANLAAPMRVAEVA